MEEVYQRECMNKAPELSGALLCFELFDKTIFTFSGAWNKLNDIAIF